MTIKTITHKEYTIAIHETLPGQNYEGNNDHAYYTSHITDPTGDFLGEVCGAEWTVNEAIRTAKDWIDRRNQPVDVNSFFGAYWDSSDDRYYSEEAQTERAESEDRHKKEQKEKAERMASELGLIVITNEQLPDYCDLEAETYTIGSIGETFEDALDSPHATATRKIWKQNGLRPRHIFEASGEPTFYLVKDTTHSFSHVFNSPHLRRLTTVLRYSVGDPQWQKDHPEGVFYHAWQRAQALVKGGWHQTEGEALCLAMTEVIQGIVEQDHRLSLYTPDDVQWLTERIMSGDSLTINIFMALCYLSSANNSMTPVEIAGATGTAASTWRNKAAAGDIPGAVKKGKQWLLPRSVLEAQGVLANRKKIIVSQ